VCQSARCPNIFECFSRGAATFLVMGPGCTRRCAFCNIGSGERPSIAPLDLDEPRRVAVAAQLLSLAHVVLTSVTRDDLPDGGAAHFAATIRAAQTALPGCSVEALVPDFGGVASSLDTVLAARPDVLNHNVETAPALYPTIRAAADYGRSLELLRRAKAAGATTKSGLMVGLGETDQEVRAIITDLRDAGCDMITIGQYLPPTRRNPTPARYVHPDTFEEYEAFGREIGVGQMFCGPLVRSSYHAANFAPRAPGEPN